VKCVRLLSRGRCVLTLVTVGGSCHTPPAVEILWQLIVSSQLPPTAAADICVMVWLAAFYTHCIKVHWWWHSRRL